MQKLINAYQNKNIIPFIGAGLSMPFIAMNWNELINTIAKKDNRYYAFSGKMETLLNKDSLFEAINLMKKESTSLRDEIDIQQAVSKIFVIHHENLDRIGFKTDNNYKDILKFRFRDYFTFNYDHIFEEIAEDSKISVSIKSLKDQTIDTQFLTDDGNNKCNLWHIHGEYFNPGSIVFTEESYANQYNNDKFWWNLHYFATTNVFLFMGVSFRDEFVKEFFLRTKDIFCKNIHYIMFSEDEKIEDEDSLLNKYGLKVIRYNSSSGHVLGLREALGGLLVNKECVNDVKVDDTSGNIRNTFYINDIIDALIDRHGFYLNNGLEKCAYITTQKLALIIIDLYRKTVKIFPGAVDKLTNLMSLYRSLLSDYIDSPYLNNNLREKHIKWLQSPEEGELYSITDYTCSLRVV